jgi:hypothetical protein
MIRIGVLVLVTTLVVGAWPAATQVAQESDISGVYDCRGVNGDGTPYHGLVVIAKHRDAYQVRWTFSPEQSAVGLGIRKGNALAVSYYGGTPGVVLYDIHEKDKELIGRWTVPGAGGVVASETLKRVKELKEEDLREQQEQEQPAPEPTTDRTPKIRV